MFCICAKNSKIPDFKFVRQTSVSVTKDSPVTLQLCMLAITASSMLQRRLIQVWHAIYKTIL